MTFKITLKDIEKPFEKNSEEDIKWICMSLGIYAGKGKNETTMRVFTLILEAASENRGTTTQEIHNKLNLSRVSAINHLNKLMDSNLVVRQKTEYRLRAPNLKRTIREVTKDIIRALRDMDTIIDDIDLTHGLVKPQRRPSSVVPDNIEE